jgi:hypothetical protein
MNSEQGGVLRKCLAIQPSDTSLRISPPPEGKLWAAPTSPYTNVGEIHLALHRIFK